jgi:transcriptional regulator with XRE-family HTH domain
VKKKSEKVFQDLRKRVAQNLARLRSERGLTFEKLGNRAGLHWRHLQKIEAGESNVTLVTIARLADGLAVDALELIHRA